MKLATGGILTDEGRQTVEVLNGLLQTVGLPNTPAMRAYASLKSAGMAYGQMFGDNPALADSISAWILDRGGARAWIAKQRRAHQKGNGKL